MTSKGDFMPKKQLTDDQKIHEEYENKRPSWDEYFMEIAHVVATRATCNRNVEQKYRLGFKGCGVVIAKDKVLLSTGYNGAPRGMEHCGHTNHEIVDGHCIRTVHGEANAIAQAAKNGVAIDGATLYTTGSSCYDCFKLCVNAGIKKVVYGQFYDSRYGMSSKVLELAKKAGIEMLHIDETKSKVKTKK